MADDYPILEFDPERRAVIEPSREIAPIDVPTHCVLCFFGEVIDGLVERPGSRLIKGLRSEMGEHCLYQVDVDIEVGQQRLAVIHPGVGAPLAAALLEEVIALGCRKFVACGSAGVLDSEIAAGHVIVPTSAVRDEGTSYHYLPPAREVEADPRGVAAVCATLEEHAVPHLLTKTWTTDAFYRETPGKVARRRAEGCLAVEMEAAAFFAVAQFRGVVFGQILYGGDDVSGEDWDSRGWHTRETVRGKLFWLAAEACLRL